MLTIPNFLTLLRIIAVPIFLVFVSNGYYGVGLVLFLAASITDTADGVIARMTDSKSELGATLDPLADKLLLIGSFALMTWLGGIPAWLFILVLSRDVIIVGGYLVIYFVTTPIEVKPSFIGKLNTCFEMMTIGFALISGARPDLPMELINQWACYVTGLTIAISGTDYIYRGLPMVPASR